MWQHIKQTIKNLSVCALILLLFLSGFPSKDFFSFAKEAFTDRNVIDNLYHALKDKNVIDNQAKFLLNSPIKKADAATFQMNSGYFIGNGASQSITGLGFRPELVILKSNSSTIAAVFKTNIMANGTVSFMGTASNDNTASYVRLDADGFTVASAGNTVNVRYNWIAFAGSDCSASGTMCIGSYTGNGSATQAISSVGFQPDLVWVKRTTSERAATWRSSAMSTNYGQYFSNTTEDTTGALFTTLDATGFTVGLSNNTSSGIYHFVAFKEVSGYMDVGTYTGNITDNRSITGVGFKPDWVFAKNANAGTPLSAIQLSIDSNGDNTSLFTANGNFQNEIQALEADGFQVGSGNYANGSGNTIYYAAFKGVPAHSSSGNFEMASGSYTGDGAYKIIEGLSFKPDLVIIKGETTQLGVFRTSMMGGDTTAYFSQASTHFTGAITGITHDGFTVGTAAQVNTSGITYHWQAFGGAWNPVTKTGSSDFFIGAYMGTGVDNTDITRLPFQPDLVVVKRVGTSDGIFRTSAHTGDSASHFAATADVADYIQAFNSDGFELGTNAKTNSSGNIYWFFGFKEGTDFDVGTYTGNGSDNRDITNPGFDPDLVMIKRSTAVAGVLRPSTLAGDLTQYFTTTAQAAGRIKSFVTGGFRLGTQTEVNANTGTYYYIAWDNNTSVSSPSAATYKVQTGYYVGNGGEQVITGLGFRPEMIILKSNTNTMATVFKTKHMPQEGTAYLGTATADATSGFIQLDSDGFTAASTANTQNIRYVWVAFAGSDCSSSGKMCIGTYRGNGSATQAISSVGFQPDLVWAKRTTNERAGTWRSSSMSTNHGQYFSNTTQDTTGALFTTLDASGFTVGLSNNTSGGVYYFVAFKESAGSIDVGTYTGNATDNRNITGVGFSPEWVFLKNANAATAVSAMHAMPESYGDSASYFTNTANLVNSVQELQADGFQVGSDSTANGSGNTIYYAAFNGTESNSTGTGTFEMASGSYTGNGVYRRISGLSFEPDLVFIKGETTQVGVFRNRSIWGDSTAYLDLANANITNAITDLNHDGFNIGTAAQVNTSGVTYHWQAFGNAWRPETNSGSADFFIGLYYGNGIDNRDITRLPFQPDLLGIKRTTTSLGLFRTSLHASDNASFFASNADTTNMIQAFNSDGFEIGAGANTNTAASLFMYYGFKEGDKFDVGTYTGDGVDNRDITDPGFDVDLLWVKTSGVAGVLRPSTLAGDATQYFTTAAQVAGRIKSFITGGFRLGTASEVNTNGSTYYFSAWSIDGVPQTQFEQISFRLFENDDSTDVGAPLEAQDTPATLANQGDAFRIRMLLGVSNANLAINGQDFKLQFVDMGSGSCSAPSGGTPSAYTDVTTSTVIAYKNNTTPADEDALTANASDPTDGGATIVNQSYQEENNFTNSEAAINNGEDGKWDFALYDNGADPDTTFCFRVVKSNGDLLDSYSVYYPEITTAPVSQSLTFSISDNSVGFGNLSASSARYATGDLSGSGTDSADAHTISVAANAIGDYILTVNGETLTCDTCGGATIDAIGGVAAASSVGTNQFGLRFIVNSGTGVSTAPYASSDWAFDDTSLPDQVASGDGDGSTTVYGVRYISNRTSIQDAGDYAATLTYTVTATY